MEYRAKPGNFCMAEAVPFGQRFNYHGEIAVKDMLHPQFFLPLRTHFRAGDSIRLVQVVDDRVAEYSDAIVIQVTREGVEVRADGPVHRIPAAAEEAPLPETSQPAPEGLYPKNIFGAWHVMHDGHSVVGDLPAKEDAIAYIEEKTGKPYVEKKKAA